MFFTKKLIRYKSIKSKGAKKLNKDRKGQNKNKIKKGETEKEKTHLKNRNLPSTYDQTYLKWRVKHSHVGPRYPRPSQTTSLYRLPICWFTKIHEFFCLAWDRDTSSML